jgi:hypothetical protein
MRALNLPGTAAAAAGLQELNDRDKFLQVLLEKYQQANQQTAPADAVAVIGGSSSSKQGGNANAVSSGPPLLPEEAIAVIIRNERGRQVRCSLPATATVAAHDCMSEPWHAMMPYVTSQQAQHTATS